MHLFSYNRGLYFIVVALCSLMMMQRIPASIHGTASVNARKAGIPRELFPRSVFVTSSRGCRACRRRCHEETASVEVQLAAPQQARCTRRLNDGRCRFTAAHSTSIPGLDVLVGDVVYAVVGRPYSSKNPPAIVSSRRRARGRRDGTNGCRSCGATTGESRWNA